MNRSGDPQDNIKDLGKVYRLVRLVRFAYFVEHGLRGSTIPAA